jgi:hypothetical protein
MTDKSDLLRLKLYELIARKAIETAESLNKSVETILSLQGGDSQYFEVIGEIAIAWSFFETEVDSQTMRLGGIHLTKGACLTSQISGIGRKLDAFISMGRLNPLPQELIKRLHKFSAKAISVSERRNRVIHDPWGPTKDGTWERIEVTARKELRMKFVTAELDELKSLATDINSLHDDLHKLADLIANMHPPSPGNRP